MKYFTGLGFKVQTPDPCKKPDDVPHAADVPHAVSKDSLPCGDPESSLYSRKPKFLCEQSPGTETRKNVIRLKYQHLIKKKP